MATRSGRGNASSILAKEKRSGLLDRAGKCLLLPVLGCMGRRRDIAVHLKVKAILLGGRQQPFEELEGRRRARHSAKKLRKASGAGTATVKHTLARTIPQPRRYMSPERACIG